jgi:hypothetical protein
VLHLFQFIHGLGADSLRRGIFGLQVGKGFFQLLKTVKELVVKGVGNLL